MSCWPCDAFAWKRAVSGCAQLPMGFRASVRRSASARVRAGPRSRTKQTDTWRAPQRECTRRRSGNVLFRAEPYGGNNCHTVVTTERDEVQMAEAVVTLESLGHRGEIRPWAEIPTFQEPKHGAPTPTLLRSLR